MAGSITLRLGVESFSGSTSTAGREQMERLAARSLQRAKMPRSCLALWIAALPRLRVVPRRSDAASIATRPTGRTIHTNNTSATAVAYQPDTTIVAFGRTYKRAFTVGDAAGAGVVAVLGHGGFPGTRRVAPVGAGQRLRNVSRRQGEGVARAWLDPPLQTRLRAIPALEEAVALYKGLGDDSDTAFAVANLGWAVMHGGFRKRIRAFVEEGESLAHGDLEGHTLAYLRTMLGCAAMAEGVPDSAVSQVEEGLAMSRELGDPRGAAKLWGAAEAHREQMGWSLSYLDLTTSDYEQDLDAARASLDETAFDAAWAEGRTMSPDLALQYALSTEEPIPTREPPRTHADERSSQLTRREI